MRHSEPTENINGKDYQAQKLSEKDFPKGLSVTVKNVSHPSFYKNWDYDYKWSPSIHLEQFTMKTKDTRYNPETGLYENYPDLHLKRLSLLANINIFGHTPVGAFYFIVGYGAALYRAYDKATVDVIQVTDILKYELSYVGFFYKEFYINLSARLFESKISTASVAIKIGYYFGELSKTTKALNK